MGKMTTMEIAYRSLWRAAWPIVRWYVRRKDARRLVDFRTTRERFGESHRPSSWDDARGPAWTLWIHGASVGECLSALPVVAFVLSPRFPFAGDKRKRVVLTTTTPGARQLLQRRLQQLGNGHDSAVCVFAPLDAPSSVARFYDEWRPNAGLWVESELWPTLINEAARRQIPIGVINARISDRSVRWWTLPLLRPFIRDVVGKFSLVLCQDSVNQSRFAGLGARSPRVATNLKFASAWQASDEVQLEELRQRLSGRSVWLAASTHEGEELLMAEVHTNLSHRAELRTSNLLTVLIPRHPTRTLTILRQIQQRFPSLRVSLRSIDGAPQPNTDIFIADTMGETGLFYDAIPTVVMGGTFVRRGGHNPIEPLRAGCHVFLGPHTFNFSDIIAQLRARNAELLTEVPSSVELAHGLARQLVAKPSSSGATRDMMQQLSVDALSTYEHSLVQWLVTEAKPLGGSSK